MRRETGPSPATVDKVWERAEGSCEKCGRGLHRSDRGMSWSVHHRRPRGAGGSSLAWVNQPANLLILCGHATTPDSCHQWTESNRADATAAGWLIPLNAKYKAVDMPLFHYRFGYCRLTNDGGHEPDQVPF